MKTPDVVFQSIYQRIPKLDKITFIISFVMCFLVHLLTYTNTLFCHDSVAIYNDSTGIENGRFLVGVFMPLLQRISMPVVIGILTSTFLALSVIFITKILEIKSRFYITLISVLMIAHPAIVGAHYYFSSAYIYAFAILMAVLAVYVIDKHKLWGAIASALLLIMSLSCYQAYICLYLSLLVIKLIIDCEDSEKKLTIIIATGIKYVVVCCAALLTYYGLWQVILRITGLEVISYRNYTGLESNLLSDFFPSLLGALNYSSSMCFANYFKYSEPIFICNFYLYLMAFITTLLVTILRKSKKTLFQLVLFVFLMITISFINVLSPGELHVLMSYASVAPLLLLIKNVQEILNLKDLKLVKMVVSWVISICLIVLSFTQVISANAMYAKMSANYDNAISYCTRLLDRLETTEGFTNDTEVVLVGGNFKIDRYNDIKMWPFYIQLFPYSRRGLTYNKTVQLFINQNLQTGINISCLQNTKDINPENIENLKELEVFPSQNCMLWIDDVLFVKVGSF